MRKKAITLLLAVLVCLLASACRQDPLLPGEYPMELTFSSGAGAWRTTLLLNADGSFTGRYSDLDMGDMDAAYPNGTVYLCTFSGRFELLPADDGATPLRLAELTCEDEVGRVEFRDGIRYIYSEPIGLYVYEEDRLADTLLFYPPDTPVAELSEEMLYFWPDRYSEAPPATLGGFALWSPESGSAFFTYPENYDS
ncbi:MAG: hypothetical protein IJB75_06935 [Oscillospiraceae bacterium]|nr:hypothetical protein [Oscillospiraceae bacterium]